MDFVSFGLATVPRKHVSVCVCVCYFLGHICGYLFPSKNGTISISIWFGISISKIHTVCTYLV